jgi:hypothetical protein
MLTERAGFRVQTRTSANSCKTPSLWPGDGDAGGTVYVSHTVPRGRSAERRLGHGWPPKSVSALWGGDRQSVHALMGRGPHVAADLRAAHAGDVDGAVRIRTRETAR